MIRRIITWAAAHGVSDVVMNLHHRPETLTAVVGDGRDLGARVRYSWEQPTVLGSAGGPRLALSIVGAPEFFLINGDTLTDVDLQQMLTAHRASGALVTLALVPNRQFTQYGGVSVDENGAVTGFVRRGSSASGSWHFIGVQVVHSSVFEPLPPNVPLASVGGVYDDLMRRSPGAIAAFCGEWAFWDVGTPADYLITSQAFSTRANEVGRRGRIDPSAKVSGSILWDDVEVGAGAVLEQCIVTDGVRVPAGSIHRRSILMNGDDGLAVSALELGE